MSTRKHLAYSERYSLLYTKRLDDAKTQSQKNDKGKGTFCLAEERLKSENSRKMHYWSSRSAIQLLTALLATLDENPLRMSFA